MDYIRRFTLEGSFQNICMVSFKFTASINDLPKFYHIIYTKLGAHRNANFSKAQIVGTVCMIFRRPSTVNTE